MRKLRFIRSPVSAVFLLVSITFAGGDKSKTQLVSGWITDSKCGAVGANGSAGACGKEMHRGGCPYGGRD
jgi:hypothetical protein